MLCHVEQAGYARNSSHIFGSPVGKRGEFTVTGKCGFNSFLDRDHRFLSRRTKDKYRRIASPSRETGYQRADSCRVASLYFRRHGRWVDLASAHFGDGVRVE